jgi:Mg-chelatase subunit ChlD
MGEAAHGLGVAPDPVHRQHAAPVVTTVPADREGDLDLDASLTAIADARAAPRPVGLDELRARAWARPTLALCLLVDASGSMGGARLAAAALTAAACAGVPRASTRCSPSPATSRCCARWTPAAR